METRRPTVQSFVETLSSWSLQPLKQVGKGQWQFSFPNGDMHRATAWLDEDWLTLEVLTPGIRKRMLRPEQLWKCLDMNPTLPAGIKFCIRPHEACPKIRGEYPLEEDICPSETLSLACTGLTAGYHRLYGKSEAPSSFVQPATQDRTEMNYEGLEEMCHSAGWSLNRRASGPLIVELEVPGNSYQATVEYRTPGLGISVRLTTVENFNEVSLHALALMLLEGSTCIVEHSRLLACIASSFLCLLLWLKTVPRFTVVSKIVRPSLRPVERFRERSRFFLVLMEQRPISMVQRMYSLRVTHLILRMLLFLCGSRRTHQILKAGSWR